MIGVACFFMLFLIRKERKFFVTCLFIFCVKGNKMDKQNIIPNKEGKEILNSIRKMMSITTKLFVTYQKSYRKKEACIHKLLIKFISMRTKYTCLANGNN